MNTETGKLLYSRVAREARQISRSMGVTRYMARGTILAAAQKIYDTDMTVRDGLGFDAWYSEVIHHGMKPQAIDVVESPQRLVPAKPPRICAGRRVYVDSFQHRYVEMAQYLDRLPPDQVLINWWKCGDGTLKRIRTLAKDYGYDFASDADGWIVTARPPELVEIRRKRKPSELRRKNGWK